MISTHCKESRVWRRMLPAPQRIIAAIHPSFEKNTSVFWSGYSHCEEHSNVLVADLL